MVVATTVGVFGGNGGTGSVFDGKGGGRGVLPGDGGTGGVLAGEGGTGGVLGGADGVFTVLVVGRGVVLMRTVVWTGVVAVVMGCVEVIWVVIGGDVVVACPRKIDIHIGTLDFASYIRSKIAVIERERIFPKMNSPKYTNLYVSFLPCYLI